MLKSGNSPRTWRIFISALMLLGVAGIICGALYRNSGQGRKISPPAKDSSVTATGNLEDAPHVVGVETCAKCHPGQAEALATSGHSRTFIHTSQSEIARALDGQTFADPERKYSFVYKFDSKSGLSVSIPGKIDRQFPLQYALGSGNHAVTFLGLVPTRHPQGGLQTTGIEHRVSVFPSSKQSRLHVTPGQTHRKAEHEVTHFGKVEEAESLDKCVECHTTSGTIERLAVINLRENVTCESCHGPGSQHVAAAEAGEEKPGHLELLPHLTTGLEQIKKCGGCHRLPEMVEASRQRRDNGSIARFQPVGLMLSRCYKESQEKMTCTTCHDPHRGTSHDLTHYTTVCLKCHTLGPSGKTACPVSPAADCVRCHMPAIPLVNNVAFTDHWIRVRDARDSKTTEPIPSLKNAGKERQPSSP